MNRAENDLFRRAIVEALSQNNREELAECTDPVVASKEHYRKMSAILGFGVRRPVVWTRTRKMWVAAIIAAAMLLAGCGIACRETIGNFIVDFYEIYIKVTDDNLNISSDRAFEAYELTYVPEGYVRTEEYYGETYVVVKWASETGSAKIIFEQSKREKGALWLDNESGQVSILTEKDCVIYCRSSVNGHAYTWCDEKYIWRIISAERLEDAELLKMIASLCLKSDIERIN